MQNKHLFSFFLLALLSLSTLLSAQSTEGTDFWVTLMRADSDNPTQLSLTISAKEATNVTIENTSAAYSNSLSVAAGGIETVVLYDADNTIGSKDYCYVGNADNKKASSKAVHVVSDKPISLIAANYKDKSFDVAAILPTPALGKEYRIQCYTPSAHEDASQGSHFAAVATEDGTVVTCVISTTGDTVVSPTLNRGQVYYYWTGNGMGNSYDLTGTEVTANKPVAVFNGNPHTNIPLKIRDRDHIYSQAMPTMYWGTQFAITSSLTTRDTIRATCERIDKIRVQALEDGTVVKVNGNVVHTFDFVNGDDDDLKHFFEFEFGTAPHASTDPQRSLLRINATSCFIEVSCPCAVHQFMVSDRYDWPEYEYKDENNKNKKDKNYCNGDPSELWINPIEEQISDITFGTFQTKQVQNHFLNIVTATANVPTMMLDGESIAGDFTPLNGNANYSFARMSITNATHNLHGDEGFIANVYGFGEKESYAYPAGGKTVPLESSITINGKKFTPTTKETLCSLDTIHFALALNYEVTKVVWGFGDGTPDEVATLRVEGDSTYAKADHYYNAGEYNAYVLIDRESSNLCLGQTAHDSIPVHVTIGRLQFQVDSIVDRVCEDNELRIYYTNSGSSITGSNVEITFNEYATKQGFSRSNLNIEPKCFRISVPASTKEGPGYGLKIALHSECGDDSLETAFTVPFNPRRLIQQRWSNVMGVKAEEAKTLGVVSYQWYKDGVKMEEETASVLNLHDMVDTTSLFSVCMQLASGEMQCTCGMQFEKAADSALQLQDSAVLAVKSYVGLAGQQLYVVSNEEGTADLYTYSGSTIQSYNLSGKGGYISLPRESGLYLLKVQYGKQKYSAKVLVK